LRALCAGIGKTFGLRHYGIDLKIDTLESDPKSATILQVKSSPLLAQLYSLGHREAVIGAWTRVLSALFAG
jgi:hypothetical protein